MPAHTGFRERDSVLDYLHTQLVGPVDGEEEVLYDEPRQRYLTAVLYPIPPEAPEDSSTEDDSSVVEDEEIVDEPSGVLVGDDDDDPVTLSGQVRPSSVGVSFVTSEWSAIVIEVRAGRYKHVADDEWRRVPLALTGDDAVLIEPSSDGTQRHDIPQLDGAASLHLRWRPHRQGAVVTVTLVNRRIQAEPRVSDDECLYQVEVCCRPATGVITRYPVREHSRHDDETSELELLYRNIPVYAVGHGAAAEWDRSSATPEWVRTSFLPTHTVPDVAFEVPGSTGILDLDRLSQIESTSATIIAELYEFVNGYRDWTNLIRKTARDRVEPHLAGAAERLIGRAALAEERMRRGVDLLARDPLVRRAFGLANRTMLIQMVHSGSDLAGAAHPLQNAPDVKPDYPAGGYYWRPFQLGFLLLALQGMVEDGHERDLVDLIWFPTGGGKTEAYLGLAAFAILHRRLVHGEDGAGTTVITRYTLRLLTAQQFQRAATMICACEFLRREHPDELGSRPISIGIWVGGGNTPNKYSDARRLLAQLQDDRVTDQGFQVDLCPWCGTRVLPGEDEDELQATWGIDATNNSFKIFCRNTRCDFHDGIPVSSVDEDLYRNPPTMLVGTVDKFARMAWDARTGVFFGSGDDPGPSLLIQDEFHLISGPLGTIVGLYEAAFDVLMAHNGRRPKIVAATATIRRANEQTRGVFGRPVALFPPAGIDADDSYFVRTVRDTPGRAYAGIMPQGHTPLTALVRLCAVLLQAPVDLALTRDVRDGYWTLVAYHNSLRELGKTITLAHDDIPARLKVVARAEDQCRQLDDDEIVELTSNVQAVRIPRVLERLGHREGNPDAVSFLASTNMLSVGVDVSRLGLMCVVGQPKTTAEYIQATSRVGRSRSRPGLVVTLYSPAKPRDRSHYESFVPYHSALYSNVEPTSVTPFSVPARRRALHADLVVLVRHALGLSADDDAARFNADEPKLQQLLEAFYDRARLADDTEIEKVREHMEQLTDEWSRRVRDSVDDGLWYVGSRGKPRLLQRFLHAGEGWPTLDSMRSVDVEVGIRVRGVRKR